MDLSHFCTEQDEQTSDSQTNSPQLFEQDPPHTISPVQTNPAPLVSPEGQHQFILHPAVSTPLHDVADPYHSPLYNQSTDLHATVSPSVAESDALPPLTRTTGHQASFFAALENLEKKLIALRRVVELWFYVCSVNLSLLKYSKMESELFEEFHKQKPYNEKNAQFMSIFMDEEGMPAPSTHEGIEKAEAKLQLPVFRKKYDWNIQIWTPQTQQRLLELISTRVSMDVVKLKVEAKFAHKFIQDFEILDQLVQERRLLRFETPPKEKRLAQALEMLDTLLDDKAQRMLSMDTQTKTLLSITPTDTTAPLQRTRGSPTAEHREAFRQTIHKTYWTNVFDDIASMMGSRYEWSGRDCQIQWLHHISPRLNLKAMSRQEDERLCHLATVYNGYSWDLIARDMNTQRTAYQCFERYQRFFNKARVKGEWKPEEDAQLMSAVRELEPQSSGRYKWTHVALRLPGRTNLQCRARYIYSLKGNLKRGHWDVEEDILLQLLIYAYGGCRWSKIAQHLPHRTDMKCRERYERVLVPILKQREDQDTYIFLSKVQEYLYDSSFLDTPQSQSTVEENNEHARLTSQEPHDTAALITRVSHCLLSALNTARTMDVIDGTCSTSSDLLLRFFVYLQSAGREKSTQEWSLEDLVTWANSCEQHNTYPTKEIPLLSNQDDKPLDITTCTHSKYLFFLNQCLGEIVTQYLDATNTGDWYDFVSVIIAVMMQELGVSHHIFKTIQLTDADILCVQSLVSMILERLSER